MASNDNCVECGKKLGLYEFNRTEKGLICNVCNGTETPEELTAQVSNNELDESPVEYEYRFSLIWEVLLSVTFVALIISGYLRGNSSNEFGGAFVVAIPLALFLIPKITRITIHKDFLVVRKLLGNDVVVPREKITKVTDGYTGRILSEHSVVTKRIEIFVEDTSVLKLNSQFMTSELKQKLASLGKFEEVNNVKLF